MSPADQATLASIAALLTMDRVSVAKALETAYTLGELNGKLVMAKIGQGIVTDVFSDTLNTMRGNQ